MSALAEVYITKEKLAVLLDTVTKKNAKGVGITISISDKTNEHGSNVSCYVSQSKEDRAAKKPTYNVGYGKVFWHNNNIVMAEKKDATKPAQPQQDKTSEDEDDLPF